MHGVSLPVACRQCREPVSAADLTCAHCGAPRPARAEFSGEGFEWRSHAAWLGAPVVHVAFGLDAAGRPRTARGWVAIGQRARGGVAVGIMATGFLAIGFVAMGVFSLGIVAVAALAAVGINALAPCAIGLFAAGYWAGGLAPFGWRLLFPRG